MEQTDNSNHKSIRVEGEVRTGITIRETIRIGTDLITDQIVETEDNTDRTEGGPDMNKILGEVILQGTLGIMVDKTVEEYRDSNRNDSYDRSRKRSRESCFPEIIAVIELEVQATVDPGQDPELTQIGMEFVVISVGIQSFHKGLSHF